MRRKLRRRHAAALEATIGVSPRYILQNGNRGPWTFGPFRPTVALPSRFDALSPDFQRAVICHELLHIKRRDITVALIEELAVATLWFHPWVWLLRARIRVAREQVVDARVVELLGDRDEYVRCLINISGHDLAPHFSQAGAGMLRPRELRARVDAIFQEAHMSRRRLAAVTVGLMMAVSATTYVAAAALPMRSSATLPPSIPEPRAVAQAPGTTTPGKLDPATSRPIAIQFKDARLGAVLDFLGFATSVVFTGYDASFDEGRSVTIKAEAPLEELLDRLLTPSGLTYSVTGPRTIAIARNPLAEVRQAMAMLERERRQINMVYPEYPQDALERGIRGTVIVDITVNPAGEVTTAAVASGPQELRASAFKAALGLKYAPGPSTIAMKIAFEYLLTGTSWGVKINGALPSIGLHPMTPTTGDTVTDERNANPDASGAYRIGGGLQPPKKLKDVPPVYPPLAQEARVQGVVIVEVRIDEQGMVGDVRTLRSIPLLDEAAIDAVKQWQYTPTLLNGVAVPVRMTVTVNFSLRQEAPDANANGPEQQSGPLGAGQSVDLIRIHVTMPDGRTLMEGELRSNVPVLINAPGIGKVHFKASRSQGSQDVTVSVFDETLQTHLGDVVLTPTAPVAQSPTSPSFGVQLLGVRSRILIK